MTKTKYREPWFLSNDNGDETWCITDGVETFPIADASQAEFGLAVNGTIERAVQPRQIDRDTVRKVITEKASILNDHQTNVLTDAILESLSPIPATGEVEWEYGVTTKWGTVVRATIEDAEKYAELVRSAPSYCMASGDLQFHGFIRQRTVARRTAGPWIEVTP